MKLLEAEFRDFRNLRQTRFEPAGGVNVLTGQNGQGKTNILEGIWLLCGQHSFRQAKDRETVCVGKKEAKIKAVIGGAARNVSAELTVTNRREAYVNGIKLAKASELGEHFAAVVFSPLHIGLVREAPEVRRAFVDSAVLSTKPGFGAVLREYDKVLFHRNYLLKSLQRGYDSELGDMLAAYTERMAKTGGRVWAARSRYTARLAQTAPLLYGELSGGETLEITYEGASDYATAADYAASLYEKLNKSTDEDIANGFSGFGPHREDILFSIQGKRAKTFASQGQLKSAALCLKLAEGRILEQAIGEKPVFLLDDVLSELDRTRQNYVLNSLGDNQIFITCCDCRQLRGKLNAAVFSVADGAIKPRAERRKAECSRT